MLYLWVNHPLYRQPKPQCRTVFQNWQDKTPKASPDEQSIMEYWPGVPQDTKSLRSCSENRAKMLLKGQLRIKCHSQYIKIDRLLWHIDTLWLVMNYDTLIGQNLAFGWYIQVGMSRYTLVHPGCVHHWTGVKVNLLTPTI